MTLLLQDPLSEENAVKIMFVPRSEIESEKSENLVHFAYMSSTLRIFVKSRRYYHSKWLLRLGRSESDKTGASIVIVNRFIS